MATLALGIAGAALTPFFPPLGYFLGAAAGAVIDSMFVMPAILGTNDNTLYGPRLDDLRATGATEGEPINFGVGANIRTAGTVIWQPNLTELVSAQGGGKGGPGGGSQTTYAYYANAAVGLIAGPVYSVERVWADTKVVYNRNGDAPVSSNGLLLPGTNTVVDARVTGPTGMSIYLGTPNQDANSLIQGVEGVNSTPAYRNLCYLVVDQLALADFGNRMPNVTAHVKATFGGDATVGLAIAQILLRTGAVTAEQFDVSSLNEFMGGAGFPGQSSALRMLEPLMLAFDLGVRESNGKLVFFKRGSESQITVPETDLAAATSRDDQPPKLRLHDGSSIDLPNEMNVSFVDPAKNYETGSVRQRKQGRIDADTSRSITLPVTLLSDEARAIAKRRLWGPHAERVEAEFSLPPSYINVEEGDVLKLTSDGEAYDVRVSAVTRGKSFVHVVRGVVLRASTTPYSGQGQGGSGDNDQPYTPPALTTLLIDVPSLSDDHANLVGLYAACAATDVTAPWRGAALYESLDDVTYDLLDVVPNEAAVCKALTVLGSANASYWDPSSTVDVEMIHGELSSTTDLGALNGENTLYLGSEFVTFVNAGQLADGPNGEKRYRLSRLLRGRRNTEGAVGAHVTNELGILLSSAWLQFEARGTSAVGQQRHYKFVPVGGALADAVTVTRTLGGVTTKQFSPCHVEGKRGSDWAGVPMTAGSIAVRWKRRTRVFWRVLSPQNPPPLLADSEQYAIEVFNGANLAATYDVNAQSEFTYTAAMQTADGLTPGSPVHLKIYQIGPVVTRGNPADVTLV